MRERALSTVGGSKTGDNVLDGQFRMQKHHKKNQQSHTGITKNLIFLQFMHRNVKMQSKTVVLAFKMSKNITSRRQIQCFYTEENTWAASNSFNHVIGVVVAVVSM